jgi:hypothetical protein
MSDVADFLSRSKLDVDRFLAQERNYPAHAVLVLIDIDAANSLFSRTGAIKPAWLLASQGAVCASFWMTPSDAIAMVAEGEMYSSRERLVSVAAFLLSETPHGERRFLAWSGADIGAGVLAVGRAPTPAS